MFENIYVENQISSHPRTLAILNGFRNTPVTKINKVEDVFGKVKKPYLQKRTHLNLFIGKKLGELIKPAPDAYGTHHGKHYYFVHAYNCIYECEYCFLQGYFSSPDIVLFVNHEEICAAIEKICHENPAEEIWFHAGEFSDNLALSNLTGEWPLYWETFKHLKNGFLELRTKSHNIRAIENLKALPNIVPSFSLAPDKQTQKFDKRCPPLAARLQAAKKLAQLGYSIGIHFDPVIYDPDFESAYEVLTDQLLAHVPSESIRYLSVGAVRFSKEVYLEVSRNYPRSELLGQSFAKAADGKMRYSRPMRLWLLKTIKQICIAKAIPEGRIYLCMEQ